MAAPAYIFTIARVAQMLGEDEALLEEVALGMKPEDGRLGVVGTDDDNFTIAFTRDGIEYLKELVAERKRQTADRRPT